MLAFIIRRCLTTIPVMLLVATGVFLLLKLTPGDPVGVILGPDASEDRRAALRDQLGLNDPLLQQYGRWLWDAAHGDLGDSLFLDRPVLTAIGQRAQPTLMLTAIAVVVTVLIGFPAGIIAAQNRGGWVDIGTMALAMIGISIPTFWLGLNLILIFGVKLRWLPVAGYKPLSAGVWESLQYLILPGITLGAAQAALLARMTRSMMLDLHNQDYVRTARAKGLIERRVVYAHALRNAMLPLINIVGLAVAALLGGAVVTEQIFNIPGVGRLLIQAIGRRDVPLVQGTVLVTAGIYVLVNLVVDIVCAALDPRVRQS
jgi:peptide/nickel transport system permease protein